MDAKKAADKMKQALTSDGTKRFRVEDRLNSRQIASYFSRKAAKTSKQKRDTEIISVMDEIIADEGDPNLVYKNVPLFEDEFDEIRKR